FDLLRLKEEEFEDVALLFKVEQDKLIIERSSNKILGPQAYLRGVFCFGCTPPCLDLFIEGFSFENLIRIAGRQEDIDLKGQFRGRLKLCLKEGEISTAALEFFNNQEGRLDLKKEASFDFLKKYLTEKSYHTLIDSLSNYTYNEAEVSIEKVDSDLRMNVNFNSRTGGKRNININFHNLLGGENEK
ncbi:MAG: hypothetical protein GF375_00625, partial [Candidatus Omnitrophica bacterium]|nr:hypothetical protein [Candidatus Omnitrophota bacterium]MBD3268663.1 hypothetical protein [Candidatus Omnitrophota bacterium]